MQTGEGLVKIYKRERSRGRSIHSLPTKEYGTLSRIQLQRVYQSKNWN